MRRANFNRVYCTFESRDSSGFTEQYRASVNYNGTAWVAYAWMRTMTDVGTQAWSGTLAAGISITVPGSADGKIATLNVAANYGLQFTMRVQSTMYASVVYYTGTEVRQLCIKITVSGTTWTLDYATRLTLGQGAVNGALVTSNAFNISSIYLA